MVKQLVLQIVSDGAFSDYADSIQKQGYDVKAIDGHSNITEASLKSSKIFVIPEANIPFKESEQAAIVNYVKQGGMLSLFQIITMLTEI